MSFKYTNETYTPPKFLGRDTSRDEDMYELAYAELIPQRGVEFADNDFSLREIASQFIEVDTEGDAQRFHTRDFKYAVGQLGLELTQLQAIDIMERSLELAEEQVFRAHGGQGYVADMYDEDAPYEEIHGTSSDWMPTAIGQ